MRNNIPNEKRAKEMYRIKLEERLRKEIEHKYIKPKAIRKKNNRPGWRDIILDILGRHCSDCASLISLEIHHIQPLSNGGLHVLNNLIVLCDRCHRQRHTGC